MALDKLKNTLSHPLLLLVGVCYNLEPGDPKFYSAMARSSKGGWNSMLIHLNQINKAVSESLTAATLNNNPAYANSSRFINGYVEWKQSAQKYPFTFLTARLQITAITFPPL